MAKETLSSTVKKLIKNYEPQIKYTKEFLGFILFYGVLLSGSLSVVLPVIFKFNLKFIIAIGILFYFIKEEIPSIFKK